MAAAKAAKPKKKMFTPAEANAMLPLLRSILRDVTTLANELRDMQEQLEIARDSKEAISPARRQELKEIEVNFEQGRDRMHDFLQELEKLGIELKDPFVGLVDFRAMIDGREVYLCWRLDEPEVAHWHELDGGFAKRQKLMAPVNGEW
jgi:hypothetical protein